MEFAIISAINIQIRTYSQNSAVIELISTSKLGVLCYSFCAWKKEIIDASIGVLWILAYFLSKWLFFKIKIQYCNGKTNVGRKLFLITSAVVYVFSSYSVFNKLNKIVISEICTNEWTKNKKWIWSMSNNPF